MSVLNFLKICVITALFAFAGCAHKNSMGVSAPNPRIAAAKGTEILCCWFVEDNGSGRQGYAAVDACLGAPPADGGGLFGSISDIREALKKQGIANADIEAGFGGQVPSGWRIRDLTPEEVSKLRQK